MNGLHPERRPRLISVVLISDALWACTSGLLWGLRPNRRRTPMRQCPIWTASTRYHHGGGLKSDAISRLTKRPCPSLPTNFPSLTTTLPREIVTIGHPLTSTP